MGFSYCLYQPNVAHCNEAVAYRILERPNTRLRLNHVGFNCEPIGSLRFMLRSPLTKSLKRVINSRNLIANNSSLLFNNCLWNSSTCGNCICLKTYRGKFVSQCQGNDSIAYIDGNGRDVESIESDNDGSSRTETNAIAEISSLKDESVEINEETEEPSLEDLRELLQKALIDLEVAQLNSTMFEEKAQRISEEAIALKDEAASAWNDVNKTLNSIQEIVSEEAVAKEAIQKATMAVSLAEARLQVAMDSLEVAKRNGSLETSGESKEEVPASSKEEEALLAAIEDVGKCRDHLASCEDELRQLENRKEELQKEIDRLNEVAEQAQMNALKAEEDVANIMLLAEQAVAFELEATQHVNDVEIAIQKAEKNLTISFIDPIEATNGFSRGQALAEEIVLEDEVNQRNLANGAIEKHGEVSVEDAQVTAEPLADTLLDIGGHRSDETHLSDASDQDDSFIPDSSKDGELDSEKSTNIQSKKQEVPKELARDSSPLNAPKALLKKSSRFFSASFFSSSADGDEFTRASVFHGLMESARKHLPKLVVSSLLLGAGLELLITQASCCVCSCTNSKYTST